MDDQIIYTSPEGEHIGLTRAEFAGSRFEALGYTELSDAIAPAVAPEPEPTDAPEEAPEAEADLGGEEPTESAHDQTDAAATPDAAPAEQITPGDAATNA